MLSVRKFHSAGESGTGAIQRGLPPSTDNLQGKSTTYAQSFIARGAQQPQVIRDLNRMIESDKTASVAIWSAKNGDNQWKKLWEGTCNSRTSPSGIRAMQSGTNITLFGLPGNPVIDANSFLIFDIQEKADLAATLAQPQDPIGAGQALPAVPKDVDQKNSFQIRASDLAASNSARVQQLNQQLNLYGPGAGKTVVGSVWASYPNQRGWSNWMKLCGVKVDKQNSKGIFANQEGNNVGLYGLGKEIKVNPNAILLFDLKAQDANGERVIQDLGTVTITDLKDDAHHIKFLNNLPTAGELLGYAKREYGYQGNGQLAWRVIQQPAVGDARITTISDNSDFSIQPQVGDVITLQIVELPKNSNTLIGHEIEINGEGNWQVALNSIVDSYKTRAEEPSQVDSTLPSWVVAMHARYAASKEAGRESKTISPNFRNLRIIQEQDGRAVEVFNLNEINANREQKFAIDDIQGFYDVEGKLAVWIQGGEDRANSISGALPNSAPLKVGDKLRVIVEEGSKLAKPDSGVNLEPQEYIVLACEAQARFDQIIPKLIKSPSANIRIIRQRNGKELFNLNQREIQRENLERMICGLECGNTYQLGYRSNSVNHFFAFDLNSQEQLKIIVELPKEGSK